MTVSAVLNGPTYAIRSERWHGYDTETHDFVPRSGLVARMKRNRKWTDEAMTAVLTWMKAHPEPVVLVGREMREAYDRCRPLVVRTENQHEGKQE